MRTTNMCSYPAKAGHAAYTRPFCPIKKQKRKNH